MSRLEQTPPRRRAEAGTQPAKRRVVRARPRYHHGDLRAVLLDHVRAIIREQGVGFVSIREVARRAHVSHAAPAHHFGNKSGLLTAFAVEGYERLAMTIRTRLAETAATGAADVLAAMGQGYVRFAIENPEHFGIMFPGNLLNRTDAAYVAATDAVYVPMMEVVERAAAEGSLTADPILVASAAWSLAHGLASLWLSGRMQARTGARDAATLANAMTHLFVTATLSNEQAATKGAKTVVATKGTKVTKG
jgi:AcrR family transcriptional regulator